MDIKLISLTVIALALSSSANAQLIERLGGLAYYDDVANLTWISDANYAQTSGDHATGIMNWNEANTWANNLTVGDVSGWRLATAESNCVFFGCTNGELGNMFYNVLGGVDTDNGGFNTNFDLFSNTQLGYIWSATEFGTSDALAFDFFDGFAGSQINTPKLGGADAYAWAVYSGDVSAVPVPAAIWLFGSGLIGLAGLAMRKKSIKTNQH